MFLSSIPSDISIDLVNRDFFSIEECVKISRLSKAHREIIQKTEIYPLITDPAIRKLYRQHLITKYHHETNLNALNTFKLSISNKSFFQKSVLSYPSFFAYLKIIPPVRNVFDTKEKELQKIDQFNSISSNFEREMNNFCSKFLDAKNDLQIMRNYKKMPKLFENLPSHFQEPFEQFKKEILPSIRSLAEPLLIMAQKDPEISSFFKNDHLLFSVALFTAVVYQVDPEILEKRELKYFKDKKQMVAIINNMKSLFYENPNCFAELVNEYQIGLNLLNTQGINTIPFGFIAFFLTKFLTSPITAIDSQWLTTDIKEQLNIHSYDRVDKAFVVKVDYADKSRLQTYMKVNTQWAASPVRLPMNIDDYTKNLREFDLESDLLFLFNKDKKPTKQYDYLFELIENKKGIDALGRPFTVG
jgi:hypothetical protein